MKKLVLFILLCGVAYAATFSELERRVFELEQQVEKLTIEDDLEIIAGNKPKAPEPKKTQTEATVVADNWGKNLNHLNFEPRNDEPTEFVFDDFEVEDSCEDKCKKKNYSDYTRNMCIKNNCGDNVDF